jgi:hypothetical protein
MFSMDPGIRNPFLAQPSFTNTNNPLNDYKFYSQIPPLIPLRRFLQVPDNSNDLNTPTVTPSDAGAKHVSGSAEFPFSPANDPIANANTPSPLAAPPAAFNYLPNQPIYHEQLYNSTANLILQTRNIQPPGAPTFPVALPQPTVNHYLGAGLNGTSNDDNRQHPYYRTELLQKLMNLTTVRTHQFAVWITIGFFEVLDPGSPVLGTPDKLGGEIGLAAGRNIRYRSFFLLDRTKATGFDPSEPGDFRDVVTYRRRIE